MSRARLEIQGDGRSLTALGRTMRDTMRTGERETKKFRKEAEQARKELSDLMEKQRSLNEELKNVKEGTAEYKRLETQLKAVGRAVQYNTRSFQTANRMARAGGAAGGAAGGGGGGGRGFVGNALRMGAGLTRGSASMAMAFGQASGQPFGAMAAMASGTGAAMGQIPFLGWQFQLQNELVAAGLRERQRRLTAARAYQAASFRNLNYIKGSPLGSAGITPKGKSIIGSNFSPGEAVSILRSFSDAAGGYFKAGRGEGINALGLSRRGLGPGAISYLSQMGPGGGGMPFDQAARSMGLYSSRQTLRDYPVAGLLGASLLAQRQQQAGLGMYQATPRAIEDNIAQMTSYLQQMSERGIELAPGGFMERQIQLFEAAKRVRGQAGITRFSMGGQRGFAFRQQLNQATAGQGAMGMLSFVAALESGMSVAEAMRAQRLGVGSGAGQVGMTSMLKTTQGVFGRGGKKFDILDALLMKEFGNPDFAALMRRMNPDDFRVGIADYASAGAAALKAIAPRRKRADRTLIGLEYADARTKIGKDAISMALLNRKVANNLISISKTGWSNVVSQMSGIVAIAGAMNGLITGVMSLLSKFGVVKPSTVQAVQQSQTTLQTLMKGLQKQSTGLSTQPVPVAPSSSASGPVGGAPSVPIGPSSGGGGGGGGGPTNPIKKF